MTIKEYTNLKKVHFLFIKNRIDSIYVLRDEKLVGIIHPEDLCALNEKVEEN
jgi:CBS domain-containing protein